MPYFYVDLLDDYNLSSIRVHAQNQWSFYDQGLHIPFSVYTWDKFVTGCDCEQQYPWHIAKKNLTYTRKGEEIVIQGPIQARYIIIMPDKDNFLESTQGLVMGELRAFGVKVRNGYIPMTYEDGPEVTNLHTETRQRLLTGQKQLRVEQAYGEYLLNNEYNDVALGWHHNRINTMAVVRDNARAILMTGTQGMDLLVSSPDYSALRGNVRSWLSPNYPNASFVKVTEEAKYGDILLVTRHDKFDVNSTYDRLASGNHSVVIGYMGNTQFSNDDATELMAKLKVKYLIHDGYYMPRDIPLPEKIESADFIPKEYDLKLGTESWWYFRTKDLTTGMSWNEAKKPGTQNALRALIAKYRSYFADRPICDRNPYTRTPELDRAFENWNRLLSYQVGSRIEPIGGSLRTPGDVHSSENATCYSVTFNVSVRGSFYPMGAYARPGYAFQYKVLNTSNPSLKGYRLRINPQTDTVRRPVLTRWFAITTSTDMEMKGEFASAFGGPIVVEIPEAATITIQFKNVYRYPWFDIRNPESRNNWDVERRKHHGVPYLMLVGNNMISMIATSMATSVAGADVIFCVNHYDNVVKLMHNYRGTDYATDRLQVFVTDEQISAGDGHSGYPWMAYRYWGSGFLSRSSIEEGSTIGIPHEIGHNLQVNRITFKDGGEVTNNLYIPVLYKYLVGLNAYAKGFRPGWTEGDEKDLISTWRGNEYRGVQVSYYNYYHRYFTAALVSNVMGNAVHSNENFDTEERKVSFWLRHMCNESGYDLVPFNRLWKLPITNETAQFCAQFPCFFPDDVLTQQVPDLVEKLLNEYGKKCFRGKPKEVKFKRDILRGVNVLDPQMIFLHENSCAS
ncbi:unnamed protein product [Dicrocoelium dendriticum]|nr:unnamed protein product [Dicrocoelium dendriticum]